MLDQLPLTDGAEKPWGNLERYTHGASCTVKVLTVAVDGTIARQYHSKRDKLWIVRDLGARIERSRGEETLYPAPEEKVLSRGEPFTASRQTTARSVHWKSLWAVSTMTTQSSWKSSRDVDRRETPKVPGSTSRVLFVCTATYTAA